MAAVVEIREIECDQVEPPEIAEQVLQRLTVGQPPPDLVAKLGRPLLDEGLVQRVIGVHDASPSVQRHRRPAGADPLAQASRQEAPGNRSFLDVDLDLVRADDDSRRFLAPGARQHEGDGIVVVARRRLVDLPAPASGRIAPDDGAVLQPVGGDDTPWHGKPFLQAVPAAQIYVEFSYNGFYIIYIVNIFY
jgi:hypothetical protein